MNDNAWNALVNPILAAHSSYSPTEIAEKGIEYDHEYYANLLAEPGTPEFEERERLLNLKDAAGDVPQRKFHSTLI